MCSMSLVKSVNGSYTGVDSHDKSHKKARTDSERSGVGSCPMQTINRLAATHQNHSHFLINSIFNILGVEGKEKRGGVHILFISYPQM